MINWCELKIEILGTTWKNVLPPDIKLPMLPKPKAVLEFTNKAKEPEASNAELGKIIESDAGLTCDLLRFINSAAYGLRQKITSTQQCLGLLGINKVKLLLAIMLTRNAMQSCDCKLINRQQFWNSNLERALFARQIASHLGADQDVAYAGGGMLQDFLLLVLSSELMNEYIQYLESTNTPAQTTRLVLHQFEQSQFGWTHSKAAAYLMTEWEFPDELICVLALHDRGITLLKDDRFGKSTAAAVATSACLPDPLNQHLNGLDELMKLEDILSGFQLNCAEKIKQEMEKRAGHNLANYISLESRLESLLQQSAL